MPPSTFENMFDDFWDVDSAHGSAEARRPTPGFSAFDEFELAQLGRYFEA